jgi:hypothetical protein
MTNMNIIERAKYHYLPLSSRSPTMHFTLDIRFHIHYILNKQRDDYCPLKNSKDNNYVSMLDEDSANYIRFAVCILKSLG